MSTRRLSQSVLKAVRSGFRGYLPVNEVVESPLACAQSLSTRLTWQRSLSSCSASCSSGVSYTYGGACATFQNISWKLQSQGADYHQAAGFASDHSGSDASVSEGDSPDEAANEFGVPEFEADLKQYAQQMESAMEIEEGRGSQQQSSSGDVQKGSQDGDAEIVKDDPLSGLSKTQAKYHLTQILRGRYGSPPERPGSENEERMEREMEDFMSGFKMQVVDVNRSNKGTRSGGIARFSTMVVVGNYQGVLGLGVGRSAELADSVKKAYAQALKNLFYVPRYRGHTIIHPVTAKYGRVKVHAYPMTSGSGVRASKLMESICRLAGLENIGIKIHGSRCARNAVKALFTAFESQQTLSQTQKALGNRKIRELAVGMFRRSPSEKIRGVEGEWYREVHRPGLRRAPLTRPPSAAELQQWIGSPDDREGGRERSGGRDRSQL